MMTESEAVKLPTAVLKENAENLAGSVKNFLLLHMNIILLFVLVVLVVILIMKIRTWGLAHKARKVKPMSTNNWFSWEDFERWLKNQGK